MSIRDGLLLRIHRTTADLPAFVSGHRRIERDIYDPWFCVACGHPHHGITRHHRLPKRVAWKIPEHVWREAIADGQRIVPMCGPCHNFIERRRGQPCAERPNRKYALLSWEQLIQEIALFERIAFERTEQLIKRMRDEQIQA